MEHFEWNSDYETGHEEIDAQHRHLFALANQLQDATTSPEADPDVVEDAIYDLTDYVVQHFADEEALMTASGWPSLPAHRALHQHLTAEVMRLAAAYFNGEDLEADKVAPFLADWLTTHIQSEDRLFVDYIAGTMHA